MERFLIQKSASKPDWWVCTDTVNKIVCQFENHKFNETQKITFLDDVENPNPLAIAKMMREMGDFLSENYYNIIF
jgi:hypothetical protein